MIHWLVISGGFDFHTHKWIYVWLWIREQIRKSLEKANLVETWEVVISAAFRNIQEEKKGWITIIVAWDLGRCYLPSFMVTVACEFCSNCVWVSNQILCATFINIYIVREREIFSFFRYVIHIQFIFNALIKEDIN